MSSSTTFQSLNINKNILKAIEELGYLEPTEIQQKAIPVLQNTNRDFVGQAQTGTGKTAAFTIPLLEKINTEIKFVQAIILTPTRELAVQVENEIQKMGKYTNIKSTCIYGGTPYEKQISALRQGKPHIVVGTPGRVIDLIKKKVLKLDEARFCVLDEADEMLNMGFFDDVQTVLDQIKGERQLMMFSATMPKPIIKMINKSFNEPIQVKIEKVSLSNDDIEQKYFIVRDKHFKEGLARLVDNAEDLYGLVFCRTKLETKSVGDDLKKRGHSVEVLNGDMGQVERDHAMKSFRDKKVNIMVCTDVAARGIDINNLTHVFNFGLPRDNESYVHRIGRTGRAGVKGVAYTIVGPKAAFAINDIQKHINKKIILAKLPTVEELKQKVVEKEIVNATQILNAIQSKGDSFKTETSFDLFKNEYENLDKDDLLKLMFVWKFNKEMRRYNNLSDIEDDKSSKPAVSAGIRKRKREQSTGKNVKPRSNRSNKYSAKRR